MGILRNPIESRDFNPWDSGFFNFGIFILGSNAKSPGQCKIPGNRDFSVIFYLRDILGIFYASLETVRGACYRTFEKVVEQSAAQQCLKQENI